MSGGRRRVVVTGMGVVAPGASSVPELWRNLLAGKPSVGPISRFDASAFPTRIAAEVRGFSIEEAPGARPEWARLDRIAQFALAAATAAVADAGLPEKGQGTLRAGVVAATGLGCYDHEEVFASCAAARPSGADGFDREAFARTLRKTVKARAPERRTPGSVPALLARELGLNGPGMSVMTACAAGTQAIGDAARWIRTGRADVVLAGGADSEIYPMGLASFCLLGALSRRNEEPAAASRPFDATRDGFVLGEGAGFLVLEERERALARGVRVVAEVAGFGSADDAWRVTDPHPEGRGALEAMRRATEAAGIRPEELAYVNAHGTSTVANDRIESRAIRTLLGEAAGRIPVSSTKSMIGHLTVAAGAVEAIVTALSVRDGRIHPTANLRTPDPACDLDFVPGDARRGAVSAALSNSFAFGGQCASLVFISHPG
jgi:3-oxoacyl-[acyl-carrier-protein] synthase II